ncbi:Gfo/Idh/MocA family protein [Fodinicola acaciae]|uniref:Gfo/Idh/MocA family protein n=1 Tax=Fodinicola acaciae TaxID=2681555 RepID=UPI0013D2035F|nr:Gfo/Idh/MocA family oxidoreductase [Fodinicola acaciae]
MRTLRVLLAGFAGFGDQDHQTQMYAPAFERHDGFTVVAATGSVAAAKELGVRHVDDLASALDECDVVSVCTRPDDRLATLKEVLAAGKHALVDKPMALSAADAEAIATAAADAGVACLPAHHLRFHPAVRSAAAAVAAGRIGLPWNVQADFLAAGGTPCPDGELVNFAVYPLDVVTAITGLAVRDVFVTSGRGDVTVLSLGYERGLNATVTIGRGPRLAGGSGIGLHRYRISGSHGTLTVDTAKPGFTLRTQDEWQTGWVGQSTVDSLVGELHQAITTGRRALGPADGVAVASVLEAAVRSSRNGRVERVAS